MRKRVVAAAGAYAGVVACVLLAWPALAQPGAGSTAPLSLEAAVTRALDANPTLVAARLQRAVDTAGVAVAGERPNPELHVEFTNELPKQAYGVALPLEMGGKRARRIAVGEAVVRIGEADVAQLALEVRADVRRAYFAHVVAVARQALQRELLDLATRSRDAAQQRFDAGGAPRLEVLQAQLAVSQAENDGADARTMVATTRVALNALLGWPVDAPLVLATALDSGAVPAQDAAIATAARGSATLARLDREIEAQHLRIDLARAQYVPDLTPEATLTRNADPEFHTGWRAAATVALPIFTRRRAAVQVEEAALSQLTAERQAEAARVTADVAAAALTAETARQQQIRYRDQVLPQALEVERIAEDSYRLGQTGIAALLQALQASRETRVRALQAAADFHNALADLERALGVPLP